MTRNAVLVEVLGGHGRVEWREWVALDAEQRFTIGRGMQSGVVLDDPYVAALHVAVAITPEGAVRLTDLGSVNGVLVGGERVRGAQDLEVPGGEFRVGRTSLRIRTAAESVAPERPDHTAAVASRAPAWAAALGGIATAAYVAYLGWLGAPQDMAPVIVVALTGVLVAASIWVGAWALLSRIVLGEWRWLGHAVIFFGAAVGFIVVGELLDLTWFMFSLPRWELRDTLFLAAVVAGMLYWHFRHASSLKRVRAATVAILLPAVVLGSYTWVQSRAQERNVNYIGEIEQFYPPALRIARATSADEFFERVQELKADADRKRAAIPAEEEGGIGGVEVMLTRE